MRVLVITSVHNPEDSRIRARQISAMLAAGWDVTYAAPFTGWGLPPRPTPGLTPIDLPRATGRRRLQAHLAARRVLRTQAMEHDVVLLHDPELLLTLHGLDELPPVVWDVHEDTAASVALKPWLPRWARRASAAIARRYERWAEKNLHLILAEPSYQARFARRHLVVPNTVRVPPDVIEPGTSQAVYIGALSKARGAHELIRIGQILHERTAGAVTLHLIGSADLETEPYLRIAQDAGHLHWEGFLPSAKALARLPGALAGISLLHDTANYRVSTPTKVMEYMAHGVPVITTPLPLVRQLVEASGAGVLVPFKDPAAAAEAILELRDQPETRLAMGQRGHSVARWQFDWNVQSAAFLAEIARVAGQAGDDVGQS